MKELHGVQTDAFTYDAELVLLSEDEELIEYAHNKLRQQDWDPWHFVGYKVVETKEDVDTILEERERKYRE